MRTAAIAAVMAALVITVRAERPDEPPGLEQSAAVHYDLSQRLGDKLPIPPGGGPARMHPLQEMPQKPGTSGSPDGAVQQSSGVLAPGAGFGFAGLGVDTGYGVNAAPPDTNGAAGHDYVNGKDLYIQWVNEAFAVFDRKTGTRLYGPTAGNALWSGFGGDCQTHNDGDPIVLFDHLANRWFFSQFAINTSTNQYLQCIAISQTSDPLGAYYRYSFAYSFLNDYPKFGVWPDAYYATHNMFQNTIFGWSFQGSKICAYDRNRMLAGLSATQQCFSTKSDQGGLLPSDLDGAAPPPAGSPNYVLNFDVNSLNLWKFHVDWANPANSSFTGPTNIGVDSFSAACGGGTCVPQSGANAAQLDTLADRLMFRLAYRNFGDHESLVVNHSVDVTANSTVGIRWYEIRNPNGAPSVFQQSTFSPDSTYRWMGSIAMDQSGDIAVGYSTSSSSLHPGIRFTGRVPADPLNTLEAETTILTGAGSQTGNLTRWGDYSSMSVDPIDDCTFWYTNEYIQNSGSFNWSTWISSFKFPLCGSGGGVTPPAAPTNLNASGGVAQIGLTWNSSQTATSYNVLRGTAPGGESLIASGVAGPSYNNTGLTAGTYYYVVQAVNAGGPSGNSNEASACATPVVPTLSATPGNAKVTLNWSASAGTTGYTVLRGPDANSLGALMSGIGGTTYTDTTAVNGTTYFYAVNATGSCGPASANSNVVSATPNAPQVPAAPTNLIATQGSGRGKINLTWTGSAGATSYNIYRSTVSGSQGSKIGSTTSTTFTNSGLSSRTRYYYEVTAVNAAGESAVSNQSSASAR